MRIDPKTIRAAGVDPKAWARYVRDPYGSYHGVARRLPAVPLHGGPFHGQRVSLREPCSGTTTFRVGDRVGRYVWHAQGYRLGEAYGYLQWEAH